MLVQQLTDLMHSESVAVGAVYFVSLEISQQDCIIKFRK